MAPVCSLLAAGIWTHAYVAGALKADISPHDELVFSPAHTPFDDNANFPEFDDSNADADVRLTFAKGVKPRTDVKGFDPFKGEYGQVPGARQTKDDWKPQLGPGGGPQYTVKLLIWPKTKFAFCWIDKNAGTQFNLLMNKLNNITRGVWLQSSWNSMHLEYPNGTKYQESNRSLSHENGWRFGTFYRDPAERFLSAWASKCQDWEDSGNNCIGTARVAKEPLDDAVHAFEDMVTDYLPLYEDKLLHSQFFNSHYDPQTMFCGRRSPSYYDYVGYINGTYEHIHNQVVKMFRDVALVPDDNTAFWDYVEELFPAQKSDSISHSSGTGSKMANYYRKPEIYKRVVDYYQEDYKILGMTPGSYGKK